jgi:hypothetical protein
LLPESGADVVIIEATLHRRCDPSIPGFGDVPGTESIGRTLGSTSPISQSQVSSVDPSSTTIVSWTSFCARALASERASNARRFRVGSTTLTSGPKLGWSPTRQRCGGR